MYKNVIIGAGEVGTALYHVFKGQDPLTMVRDRDPKETQNTDVMHICFPYSSTFVTDVQNYIEQYGPRLTIVYSTVPVGTCEQISDAVVHSPVEGVHPNLTESFKTFTRWLGSSDDAKLVLATQFWYRFVSEVLTCDSARYTEFLKLRSTSKYGINLVWTDYEKNVADELGMDFDYIKAYDQTYNELFQKLHMPKYQRYILDPPYGEIGGHCILPNAKILDDQFPHPLLKRLKKMRKGDL